MNRRTHPLILEFKSNTNCEQVGKLSVHFKLRMKESVASCEIARDGKADREALDCGVENDSGVVAKSLGAICDAGRKRRDAEWTIP